MIQISLLPLYAITSHCLVLDSLPGFLPIDVGLQNWRVNKMDKRDLDADEFRGWWRFPPDYLH